MGGRGLRRAPGWGAAAVVGRCSGAAQEAGPVHGARLQERVVGAAEDVLGLAEGVDLARARLPGQGSIIIYESI